MRGIAIRVDGSEARGMGHIFRMVTLAKALRKLAPDVNLVFVIQEAPYSAAYLRDQAFKVQEIRPDLREAAAVNVMTKIIKSQGLDGLIVDKFDVSLSYLQALKKTGIKIVQFYYDRAFTEVVDLAINPNLGAKAPKDIKKGPGKCLVGGDYALVKAAYQQDQIKVKDRVEEVFISFGGGDQRNLTPRVIDLLGAYYKKSNLRPPLLNIVIGPVYANEGDIIKALKKSGLRSHLIFNFSDLSGLMQSADLAITALGGTIYELLCSKTPVMGLLQSQDQVAVAGYLQDQGAILNLGDLDALGAEVFFAAMDQMQSEKKRRQVLQEASHLIDGKGGIRCAKAILALKKDTYY